MASGKPDQVRHRTSLNSNAPLRSRLCLALAGHFVNPSLSMSRTRARAWPANKSDPLHWKNMPSSSSRRFAIVGGGIVGLATAYRLHARFPGAAISVYEKESAVGRHQTGHNSGVLHSGLYYKPGTIKARLAVSGIRQMVAFCQENNIPHEVCGKLVVAADESEVPRLRALEERGHANGLEGLRWLTPPEMREIEPHVGGVAALRVPQEGIVDYPRVCEVLVEKLTAAGVKVVTNARVDRMRPASSGWTLETTAGAFAADFLINCGGLHCDRVAEHAGE